jgi:hypothetical protein
MKSSEFLQAAANGQIKVMAWLLERGDANIDEVDQNGNTAWVLMERKLCCKLTSSTEVHTRSLSTQQCWISVPPLCYSPVASFHPSPAA